MFFKFLAVGTCTPLFLLEQTMTEKINRDIRAIIGLGNPGKKFDGTRHNIGFAVIDQLAEQYNGTWKEKDNYQYAEIQMGMKNMLLIKPQTFMNLSGQIMPHLAKKGIDVENIIVVHDELEIKFSKVSVKVGGSHRGHNGLRSLINFCGADFVRIRCGIDRPEHKEDVADYVLQRFSENESDVIGMVYDAATLIENML